MEHKHPITKTKKVRSPRKCSESNQTQVSKNGDNQQRRQSCVAWVTRIKQIDSYSRMVQLRQ